MPVSVALAAAARGRLEVRLEPGDALELETYRKGFMIAYLGQEEAPGVVEAHDEVNESRYIPPMRGH